MEQPCSRRLARITPQDDKLCIGCLEHVDNDLLALLHMRAAGAAVAARSIRFGGVIPGAGRHLDDEPVQLHVVDSPAPQSDEVGAHGEGVYRDERRDVAPAAMTDSQPAADDAQPRNEIELEIRQLHVGIQPLTQRLDDALPELVAGQRDAKGGRGCGGAEEREQQCTGEQPPPATASP
jgi:hypothetical protein